ncbi:S16 family serine protease [Evansella tamaricis]|uniref:Lon proteolytic domain-containing protein n=1 Tax=Evansella tamaricis TaxID=2069301 RepID=A0ABS6JGJ9_9BACI|nr:S16 family serine protease [Evansella tamaricis]MBU9712721.1 hypothetical protein [Evansella tamaricis]
MEHERIIDSETSIELELKRELDRLNHKLAILYAITGATIIYGLLWFMYFFDWIGGFVFVGAILFFSSITIVFLILQRKRKNRRLAGTIVLILLAAFLIFELPILQFESHTYHVSSYYEPEDLLGDSGIHILAVNTSDIYYIEDREWLVEGLKKDGIEVLEVYEVTNKDRFNSKMEYLIDLLFSRKSTFQVMGENVREHIVDDIDEITSFLQRENLDGNSAGLALGLTAMVYRGELENKTAIGVTGTLEPGGEVGPVGMVMEKTLISELSDLSVIIVPEWNVAEAEYAKQEYGLSIEIISATHIDEAVEAILQLNKDFYP